MTAHPRVQSESFTASAFQHAFYVNSALKLVCPLNQNLVILFITHLKTHQSSSLNITWYFDHSSLSVITTIQYCYCCWITFTTLLIVNPG